MHRNVISWTILLLILLICIPVHAQKTETLFGEKSEVGFLWGANVHTISIQDDLSSSLGFGGGVIVNHMIYVGLAVSSNVTHDEVNHSSFGVLVRYNPQPNKVYHFGGELLIGRGSTKDYENEKTNAMDNFGNTSGPSFFVVEPSVFAEVNLHEKIRLAGGLGYRFASGIDENDELIEQTKVSDADLSGLSFKVGLWFGLH